MTSKQYTRLVFLCSNFVPSAIYDEQLNLFMFGTNLHCSSGQNPVHERRGLCSERIVPLRDIEIVINQKTLNDHQFGYVKSQVKSFVFKLYWFYIDYPYMVLPSTDMSTLRYATARADNNLECSFNKTKIWFFSRDWLLFESFVKPQQRASLSLTL